MTPEKLKKNLEMLRKAITRKPEKYEPDYAFKFCDSFTRYTRTSTINLILSLSELLLENKWPFPAYILESSGNNWGKAKSYLALFSISFLKKIKNSLILFNLPFKPQSPSSYEKDINNFMVVSFSLHEKNIFIDWRKNHNFQDKFYLIDNIRTCYKKGLWYACIVASFPLLDLLCRKYFNSNKLERDISSMLSTFKTAGITSNHLKPGYIAWDIAKEQGLPTDEVTQTDLRLIGIGLGSFLDFAGIYYSWYRKDKGTSELNRHAIIHCASVSSDLWTRENATKLLIFIDLTLRLEYPLCILLKED